MPRRLRCDCVSCGPGIIAASSSYLKCWKASMALCILLKSFPVPAARGCESGVRSASL